MEKSEKILHEKFVEYGRSAREWTRKCALLLPEIARLEIWKKRGFGSIYEYAAKLAGMSHAAVDDALWIARKIEDKPELMRIAEQKGINAVRPIVAIATKETADFWAEKVREMSVHTLQTYVREFKKADLQARINGDFRDVPKCLHPQDLFSEINLRVKPEIAEKLQKLKGSNDWNELMEKFIELYEEKVEEQKPTVEEIPEKAKSRYVPAAIKSYALAKTNGACAFPSCYKPYEILHHTDGFALTHSHNPDKLVPLCRAHERLAHLGLIENENKPPNEWRVRTAADKTEKKYLIDRIVVNFRKPRQ